MVNPIDITGNTEEEEEEEEEEEDNSCELILFKLIMMKDTFELNSLVLALLTFTLFKVIKVARTSLIILFQQF